ncbi:hypothetical protein [Salinicoccus roseus]|uniref:hypothetical protein n=1 Tax=Salinicoccus roseus TaxID=45670 RepID=UPI001EF6C169|nr:hypothetical protein [Salinicoccus roseus]MCG7332149.1 hypothetical protein [Salinicoccus roseus]
MGNDFRINKYATDFIESLALSNVKSFYPDAFAKYAKISLQRSIEELLDFTESGALELKWEIRCPNVYCHKKIDGYSSEQLTEELNCDKCGQEFILSNDDLFIRFDIKKDYKEFIKSETSGKKKENYLVS